MLRMNRVNKQGVRYQLIELLTNNPPQSKIMTGDKEIIVNYDLHTLSQSWYDWVILGIHIQLAFNYLTSDEREFIKTGITPTEWNELFEGIIE